MFETAKLKLVSKNNLIEAKNKMISLKMQDKRNRAYRVLETLLDDVIEAKTKRRG
jgi:hypothetical protein